jgi:beta-lactamase class A
LITKKTLLLILLVIAASFGVGLAIGYISGPGKKTEGYEGGAVRKRGSSFSHPLIECNEGNSPAQKREIAYFESELKGLTRNLEAGLGVSKVAVYFRDMKNGPWVGVKQDLALATPKRYELPLAIACLKQGEKNVQFFDRMIPYTGKEGSYDNFWPLPRGFRMTPGEFSVGDLVERMLTHNDPIAANLLFTVVDKKILEAVFDDLSINSGEPFMPEVAMTPEVLSRFLRLLYNASYLSRKMSETTLTIMTENVYKDALVAGVPSGTAIPHNFSINLLKDDANDANDLWQVFDAGIIYYPGFPYTLSVMTQGSDPRSQIKAIAEVSRFIYGKVDKHMKTKGGDI